MYLIKKLRKKKKKRLHKARENSTFRMTDIHPCHKENEGREKKDKVVVGVLAVLYLLF